MAPSESDCTILKFTACSSHWKCQHRFDELVKYRLLPCVMLQHRLVRFPGIGTVSRTSSTNYDSVSTTQFYLRTLGHAEAVGEKLLHTSWLDLRSTTRRGLPSRCSLVQQRGCFSGLCSDFPTRPAACRALKTLMQAGNIPWQKNLAVHAVSEGRGSGVAPWLARMTRSSRRRGRKRRLRSSVGLTLSCILSYYSS